MVASGGISEVHREKNKQTNKKNTKIFLACVQQIGFINPVSPSVFSTATHFSKWKM